MQAVTRYLAAHTGASGHYYYCPGARDRGRITARRGLTVYAAARYHADLSADERQRNQDAILYDEARVMGGDERFQAWGIDKSMSALCCITTCQKHPEAITRGGRARQATCW